MTASWSDNKPSRDSFVFSTILYLTCSWLWTSGKHRMKPGAIAHPLMARPTQMIHTSFGKPSNYEGPMSIMPMTVGMNARKVISLGGVVLKI